MVDFCLSVSSTGVLVIKRLMVNYDTPRKCLNFNWTDLLLFLVVWRHVTFKLRVFRLWQTNFACYEELTGSPVSTFMWIPIRYLDVRQLTLSVYFQLMTLSQQCGCLPTSSMQSMVSRSHCQLGSR